MIILLTMIVYQIITLVFEHLLVDIESTRLVLQENGRNRVLHLPRGIPPELPQEPPARGNAGIDVSSIAYARSPYVRV